MNILTVKSHNPLYSDWDCVCAKACPTLCDPMDCRWGNWGPEQQYKCLCSVASIVSDSAIVAGPGSSVHGILQARILEWLLCPPPGDLPDPGIEPKSLASLALAGGFFTTSATWESHADWGSIAKQTAWDGCSYKSTSLSWGQGKLLSHVLVKP